MQEIAGKTAFITGGGSGIGLGIGAAFAAAGMNVVLADLRPDHLDGALDLLRGRGQSDRVHAIQLDVTDRAAFEAAAQEAERRFGAVSIAVNNAGIGIEGPFAQATFADWDCGLAVNLGGVINGMLTLLPRLRRNPAGGT